MRQHGWPNLTGETSLFGKTADVAKVYRLLRIFYEAIILRNALRLFFTWKRVIRQGGDGALQVQVRI